MDKYSLDLRALGQEIFTEVEHLKNLICEELANQDTFKENTYQWANDVFQWHLMPRDIHHTTRTKWGDADCDIHRSRLYMSLRTISHHTGSPQSRWIAAEQAKQTFLRHHIFAYSVGDARDEKINKLWDKIEKIFSSFLIKATPLLYKMASIRHKYYGDFTFDEVLQIMRIGFMEAMFTYDFECDCNFVTHAYLYMKKVLTRTTEEESFLIRLPSEKFHNFMKSSKDNLDGKDDWIRHYPFMRMTIHEDWINDVQAANDDLYDNHEARINAKLDQQTIARDIKKAISELSPLHQSIMQTIPDLQQEKDTPFITLKSLMVPTKLSYEQLLFEKKKALKILKDKLEHLKSFI